MKLTDKQRDHIMQTYLDHGYGAAKHLAAELGLGRSYVRNARWRWGLPKCKREKAAHTKWEDPRWAWARERGSISL